jgi:hypothetical protein
MNRALLFLVAVALVLTARQATTAYKPVSAEAWQALGVPSGL